MAVIVKVDIRGMERVVAAIKAGPRTPEIKAMFHNQAHVYGDAMTRRFGTFSRGGGTWPPLARSTLVGRANKRDRKTAAYKKLGKMLAQGKLTIGQYNRRRSAILTRTRSAINQNREDRRHGMLGVSGKSILVDKGTLRRVLSRAMQQTDTPTGLEYAFPAESHPQAKGLTVRRLAAIHHFGQGVPARPLLVDPSPPTLRRFEQLGAAAVKAIAERNRIK